MGSSSKKKRGKQRKAARNQNVVASNDSTNTTTNGSGTSSNTSPNWLTETIILQTIKEHIQRANNDASVGLINLPIPLNMQRTVLPVILGFLKRCDDKTFDEVMADARCVVASHRRVGVMTTLGAVGGDLVSPSTWIKVLSVEDWKQNFRLENAENIGPLVKCMCNDTECLFFRSNKHWKEGIVDFVEFIYNLLKRSCNTDNSEDKKITNTLLQHEGLLQSIVQWGYWKMEHRPDIVRELTYEKCTRIVNIGQAATKILLGHAGMSAFNDNLIDVELGKRQLEMIGTTPIVSKVYDPDCIVSLVVGLIRRMKIEGWLDTDISSLRCLIGDTPDCVDREVITEIISLGLIYSNDCSYNFIERFVAISTSMLHMDEENDEPSDTRCAVAIRAGLIEMCLSFIERFGGHPCFDGDADDANEHLCQHISLTLDSVYQVSLHQKAAKAIRSKRDDIEEKLMRVQAVMHNTSCKTLFETVRCILDINGTYCCRCNKPLSRTKVLQCNGCGRMSYCSRACQREDWSNGHKLACNKLYTYEDSGQCQGRYEPIVEPENNRAATKLKELETNINMIQKKMFLDNAETILNQSEALNLPLYDCVVHFDLKRCPPYVEVQDYREEFTDAEERRGFKCPPTVRVGDYREDFTGAEERKGFEDSRSKENITCAYYSNFFIRDMDEGDESPLCLQRLFHQKWLCKKK